MNAALSAHTRLVALLGDPVSHSLSPTFQNAAIAAAGLDARYLAIRVASERIPAAMALLAEAGGGGNVTVPHKAIAASTVERCTTEVEQTGACNTFWMEEGELCGDNTDVRGFARAVESLTGSGLRGRRILLLGAGGSARAVALACQQDAAREVVIVNRSSDRAEALAGAFHGALTRFITATKEDLEGESFDLVVNATTIGLGGSEELPLAPDSQIRTDAAIDLVYSPTRTAWIRQLRASGVTAEDGLEMLLFQGAASFERWFGMKADIQAMRAALPSR